MAQPKEIEGYVALWGSPDVRDCYGTYFDREAPPQMDLEFLPVPLRYEHGHDDEIGGDAIGAVDRVWVDSRGIRFHATLNDQYKYYPRIASEVAQNKMATSSGTQEYLSEFDENNRFVRWPLAELSLTASPCEYRMPAVAAVRSLPGQHFEFEIRPDAQRGAVAEGDPRDCGCDQQANSANGKVQRSTTANNKDKNMKVAKRAGMPPAKVAADGGTEQDAPAEKRGLALSMLGLTPDSTLDDVVQALIEMFGPNVANAMLEQYMGPEAEAQEDMPVEDQLAEPDTRPENYMGDTNSEDLSQGKPGTPSRQAAALVEQLQRALSAAAAQTAPRSKPQTEVQQLQRQINDLKRMMLRGEDVDAPTPKADRRNQTPSPVTPQFSVRDLRYDSLRAEDLSYAIKTLEAAGKNPSDSLIRAASVKIAQEIEKGTPVGSDLTVQYLTPFRRASDVMSIDAKAIRSMATSRANEVMGDGNSGYGSNYVGTFYDTSLWLKVRAMPIWRELEARGMEEKVIPVGYSSDVIPLEGADFSWYRVPETTNVDSTGRPQINIPASKAGTSSTTLTVRTLGALVYYSVLMEEDSIVPMAAELNRKANIQAQEQIEYTLFNGDTSTGTGNLNYKNGTVNASDVYNFTVLDGILKSALIGNSGGNARAAGGLSDLDYQLLFGLLGNNGITGSDPEKLLFVVDPQTGLATDRLPIVKTRDINSAATVEDGKAKRMYGVPIFRSGQIALADSTGYIDSVTAANNKYGRIVCVRPDQFVVGFKRQVTMEFFRDVPGQSNGMVITMRLGLQVRDATQCASASYNVTVK